MKILSLLFLLIFTSISLASKDINKLLANDLNIIASKLDDIPETNVHAQLVLVAYGCRNVMVSWKTNNTLEAVGAPAKPQPQSDRSKIFGFQVVIREYLIAEDIHSKKFRVFTSKFIGVNHSRFKLTNLLYSDSAKYLICLVIYFDAIETVAFEKECVTFDIPISLTQENDGCEKEHTLKTQKSMPKLIETTTTTTTESTTTFEYFTMPPVNNTEVARGGTADVELSIDKNFTNLGLDTKTVKECTSEKECKSYSNLMIAFIVCVFLLALNIFMFTVIIIQNLVRHSIGRKLQNVNENDRAITDGSSQNPSSSASSYHYHNNFENSKMHAKNGKSKKESSSFKRFCLILCCGAFMNVKTKRNRGQNHVASIRPGYVFQGKNSTIATDSYLESSLNRFPNFAGPKLKSQFDRQFQDLNQNFQCYDPRNRANALQFYDPYDREIFYYHPPRKMGPQISSAF